MARFIFLALFPLFVYGEAYNSKTLRIKDYEGMRSLVQEYAQLSREKANSEEGSVDPSAPIAPLKTALKLVLMRPDTDHFMSALLLTLQDEIMNHRPFFAVFRDVVAESVKQYKSSKSIAEKVSLLYITENSIAYLQSIDNPDSTKTLRIIKQADLKISKKMRRYLLLEMGRGETLSPSLLAGKILRQRRIEQKALAKIQAAKEEAQAQAEDSTQNRDPAQEPVALELRDRSLESSKKPAGKADTLKKPVEPASDTKAKKIVPVEYEL